MIKLIIMILISGAVGLLFMYSTDTPMLSNLFVFGFATMGFIGLIRHIIITIRGISVKSRGKLVSDGDS